MSTPLATRIDIREFGAKCDGVTDDTAAFQAAINALPANGGTVLLPQGNIKISSTITIGNGSSSAASSRNGICIMGQGQGTGMDVGNPIAGTSIRWYGPADYDVIRVDGPVQYVRLSDFHIEGAPNGLSADSAGIGLHMIDVYLSDIRRITVAGTSQWGFVYTARNTSADFAAGAGDTNLDMLYVERTKSTSGGILLGPDTYLAGPPTYRDVARVNLHNCVFGVGSSGVGVRIRFVDSSSMQQILAFGGTYGLQVDEVLGDPNNYPDAITMRDCYFSGTTADTNIPPNWHSTVAGSVNGGLFFSPWPMEMGAPPSSPGVVGYTSTNQHLQFALYKRNVAITNGDNNDLDIGGNTSSARLSGASGAAALTGLKHGRPGKVVTLLVNIGGQFTVKNQSASSSSGNRIAVPGGSDWTSASGVAAAVLQWDDVDGCWYFVSGK